jgi:hypothetical protein
MKVAFLLVISLAFACYQFECAVASLGMAPDQCVYYDSDKTTFYV